jgi:1,4-dihydroxy-2-naphthoate octaprenyltransferase
MRKNRKLSAKEALGLAAPHTWVCSIYPALFAFFYARHKNLTLSIFQAIFLLIACILMQSAANTVNDYADFVSGVDSKSDNVEKSDSILVYNKLEAKSALRLALIFLGLALLFAIFSFKNHVKEPLLIGGIGALFVFLYSMGPVKISYLPLGELVSALLMGALIPMGILAVADGRFHFEVFFFALPLILGIGLVMMTNNTCDIEKDIRANRLTFPARIGRDASKKVYRFAIILWVFVVVVLSFVFFSIKGGTLSLIGLFIIRRTLKYKLDSPLLAENRILEMKSIVKLNYQLNGLYLLVLFISLVGEKL